MKPRTHALYALTLTALLALLTINAGCAVFGRKSSPRLTGATQYRSQIEQGLKTSWATLRAEYPSETFHRFDIRRDRLEVIIGTQPGMRRGSVDSDGQGNYRMYVPPNPDQGFFDHEGLHLHLYKSGHDGHIHHGRWSRAFRKHP